MQSSSSDMGDQTNRERQPKFPAAVISRVVAAVRHAFAGRASSRRRMNLLETLQLGGKRQLMLVLCDGQKYLVGAGSDSVHSIAEIREQKIAASVNPSILGDGHYTFQPGSASLSADRKMGLSH
jgi:hypothetical protein